MYLSTVGNEAYDTYLLLRQTDLLCEKLIGRICRLHGLTVPGLEVLYTVMAGPKPMSAYRLATYLDREHHSVVELVNRLKKKGWIARKTVDGRPSLEVTEAGRALVTKVLSTPALQPTFESLGKSGIKKLYEALLPLRAEAGHELGLMDLGEVRLTPPNELTTQPATPAT